MNNSTRSSSAERRCFWLYLTGAVLFLTAAALGILLGSTPLSLSSVFHALFHGDLRSADARIFLYSRLPRTLSSLSCGAALAVSGAVIQGVLANRLASPSVIGVNAGAGLAVTLCAAFGLLAGWQVSLFAFLGAFAAVMAVSLGAKRWGASRGTVILMGVALNSLLGALSDTVITLLPEVGILGSDFRVGSFAAVSYSRLLPAMAVILAALLALRTLHNSLDVLSLGEENARALGMNTGAMRALFLLLAALLAGSAVSVAGLLSFVGLLVPHGVRRAGVRTSRNLMGLCALFGGGFVCLCDTLARTVFAPYELPVGILMAYLGAPFFLYILIKGKGGHRHD